MMAESTESATDLETIRNATLQRIGRNVVNLQKLEGMLKFLLAFGDIHAPVSQLKAHVAERIKKMAGMTLGSLVKSASKALFAETEPPSKIPARIEEPWISFSFALLAGGEMQLAWEAEYKTLVDERNRLIHQMLNSFDPNSIESCHALDADLEAQRAQISVAYRSIESMVKVVQEALADAAAGKGEITEMLAP